MHLKRFFNKIPRAKIYLEPFTLFILFFKVIFKKPRKRSKTKEWEDTFKKYFDKKEAIALPKARIAFYFLLKNLDLPKNSEIIITPLTIADMVNAIVWAGHKPVFCDLGEQTYNINYEDLENKITPKTKSVLVTHLNGFATNMDKVLAVTQKHNLRLIEDVSQSFGTTFNSKLLGTFGTAGIFSTSFLKSLKKWNDAYKTC